MLTAYLIEKYIQQRYSAVSNSLSYGHKLLVINTAWPLTGFKKIKGT